MLTATDLEIAVAGRTLIAPVSFSVASGDRIGLVGRNGAGKTTLARVLAGEAAPHGGVVQRLGSVAYLPQDPREGDLSMSVRDRVLSARGLDAVVAELALLATKMAKTDDDEQQRVLRRYGRLEEHLESLGGWNAETEARSILSSLSIEGRILDQSLHSLSGGQRRRVELARVLFAQADTLLLDEPTNHLDVDSVLWLRGFLQRHDGGLVVISHDTALVESTVNRVFHLDASRTALDVYNLAWKGYVEKRASDERRRIKERKAAERKIVALSHQADRMRATATKARAAHQLDRRAQRISSGLAPERRSERVARLRFPDPAPCGRTPLIASGLTRRYGSLEVFAEVGLAIDRGSRVVVLGLNGAGKTTLLRVLAGIDEPDAGAVIPGHGLRIGYYAQEHETLDPRQSVFHNLRRSAPGQLSDLELRSILGAFLFSGARTEQLAGSLSGGEKTRLALATLVVSSANVLLLDEPTNNLDPESRAEVLGALSQYRGAIVLVTHDAGAVQALGPERVLLMPDGVEDLWRDDLSDLVALA